MGPEKGPRLVPKQQVSNPDAPPIPIRNQTRAAGSEEEARGQPPQRVPWAFLGVAVVSQSGSHCSEDRPLLSPSCPPAQQGPAQVHAQSKSFTKKGRRPVSTERQH